MSATRRSADSHGGGFYVVAIDLFRIATAAELSEELVAKTIANRSALRRILHRTRRAGRLVADVVETAAVVMRGLSRPAIVISTSSGAFMTCARSTKQAWVGGLRDRFAADESEIEARALARLIEHRELHPRSTMLAAQKTDLTSVELDTRSIGLSTVGQRLKTIGTACLVVVPEAPVQAIDTAAFSRCSRRSFDL